MFKNNQYSSLEENATNTGGSSLPRFRTSTPTRPRVGLRGFVPLAALVLLAAGNVFAHESSHQEDVAMEMITLFEYSSTKESWINIDDVVMGGVSSSDMRINDGVAVFEGQLSLENNGGFASVRSESIQMKLGGYDGVRIRVKGDGNSYQLRIRTSSAFDGPSYQLTFNTKRGLWTEIDLPFGDFTAAFRGRQLPHHPKLDPANIATLGFLIADKQEGPFVLQADWIKAFCADTEKAGWKAEGGEG